MEELELLLFDWEEGTLDVVGVERVREILRTDEEARIFYVRQQTLTAALRLEGDAGLAATEPGHTGWVASKSLAQTEQTRRFLVGVAAAALICTLVGRLLYLEFDAGQGRVAAITPQPNQTTARKASDEATSRGVALVTRLIDIEWAADQRFDVGDAVEPGRFAIASGFAQVEFFCGATVILEGPAELELKSSTLARVHLGRLRAQVPPAARGFSLEVDDMKVVDLGTEFGLSVSDKGADLQVFDGEVELVRPTEQTKRLTAGQALRRSETGVIETSKATPLEFLDIGSLESRAKQQTTVRHKRWQAWSKEMRKDRRLIAYYGFDQTGGWNRRLQSSIEPPNHELDGAIVGADRTDGRWPGVKSALEFKQPGDRVRVQIPGEFSSLSFTCWAKIDSLDRWYNSLFLTDGYNQGEPHWQILDTGQLFFSVRVSSEEGGPEHREVLSPPFWNPSLSGKWLHLATTFDVDKKKVTHYLDGELIHEENIPDAQLVRTTRFGRASIGNWSSPQRPDADFAIRNLNGSIDEFTLYSAALSHKEIKDIYEHGKP